MKKDQFAVDSKQSEIVKQSQTESKLLSSFREFSDQQATVLIRKIDETLSLLSRDVSRQPQLAQFRKAQKNISYQAKGKQSETTDKYNALIEKTISDASASNKSSVENDSLKEHKPDRLARTIYKNDLIELANAHSKASNTCNHLALFFFFIGIGPFIAIFYPFDSFGLSSILEMLFSALLILTPAFLAKYKSKKYLAMANDYLNQAMEVDTSR